MMLARVDELSRAAHANLAQGNADAAKDYLVEAREEDCDRARTYIDLAEVAMSKRQYTAAASLLKRALAVDANNALSWARLGNALWRCQRYDESAAALEHARQLEPDHHHVEHNLGLLDYFTGDARSAVQHLQRARDRNPNNAWIENDYAHAVLKSGDLKNGLHLFEARWPCLPGKSAAWDCGLPLWNGERHGGTIFLHAEQGFGDTLQFIRFVPLIKALGGFYRVMFAGPVALKRLLENQCNLFQYVDFERVGDMLRAVQQCTCHSPLVSAVAHLNLSYEGLPQPRPYLVAPAGPRRDFRAGGAKLAVGLVWAASVGHERSRQRSVSILDLLPLGEIPGVRLWSLQMAPFAREAIDTGADALVSDATMPVMDFADTAAIVEKLDAVVTVDTSMVHLAGALGKTCFMLNPINSCWRWCNGAGPWYGSVELFEQERNLSWAGAIGAVKARIAEMADGAV